MKLRISGDSIRLRLRKPEVQLLLSEGGVTQSAAFGAGSELIYRLELGADLLTASFNTGELVVRIPHSLAQIWAVTDQVGMAADQPAGHGRTLRILIEKDFACSESGTSESQDGAFENPIASQC